MKSSRPAPLARKAKKAAPLTRNRPYRDKLGRFARPVKFDGKHYRDATGKIRPYATRAKQPSIAYDRRKIVAKPVTPKKGQKRRVARPRPSKPQRPPLMPRVFGRGRADVLIPIVDDIADRLSEAEQVVQEAIRRKIKATTLSDSGLEYYQLIATLGNMSASDIYTLFMSPNAHGLN